MSLLSLRQLIITPKRPQALPFRAKMSNSAPSQAGPGPSSLRNLKPPSRLGMLELDRTAFNVDVPILSIKVKASEIDRYRSNAAFRRCLLDIPKTRMVVPTPDDSEHKLLRLRMEREEEVPEDVMSIVKKETAGLVQDSVTLDYEHWTTHDILTSVLPPQVEDIPSGFTITGHIAHMNLRDEWLPYKNVIGQVILDKNRNLRTVVNKLNSIHAQFRYFDMEVLAGDNDFIAQVSESGCLFTFDFSLVYWNSRLHHEHERIIATLEPDEVVVDVMAGVGPFAVPAAKKGCSVFGNDLNPESVKWMEVNRVKNKVQEKLRVSEIDGHSFIKTAPELAWTQPFAPYVSRTANSTREEQRAARKERERRKAEGLPPLPPAPAPPAPAPTPRLPDHYIMNLPDSALSFLPSFPSSYTSLLSNESFMSEYPDVESVPMPLIHVYCFTREMEPEGAQRDIIERASGYLGHAVTPENVKDFNLHLVRSVAPQKEMYCLSFRLPREVAFKPL